MGLIDEHSSHIHCIQFTWHWTLKIWRYLILGELKKETWILRMWCCFSQHFVLVWYLRDSRILRPTFRFSELFRSFNKNDETWWEFLGDELRMYLKTGLFFPSWDWMIFFSFINEAKSRNYTWNLLITKTNFVRFSPVKPLEISSLNSGPD